MIHDLTLTPLKIIDTNKGSVMRALRETDNSFLGFGEAYFSKVKFNTIKGWKRHKQMTLNIVVPSGEIKFVVHDNREKSISFGEFYSVILSPSNYCRLTIPPNLWVAFKGLHEKESLLLNIANIEHNSEEADVLELNEIFFDWEKS